MRTVFPCLALTVVAAALWPLSGCGPGPAAEEIDPLAERLCEALHGIPTQRKSECCQRTFTDLAGLCTQELSASLRRGAVRVDSAGIDRCAGETSRRLEGCGWVTPLLPSLPVECRDLIVGRLEAGASCRSSLECVDGLHCRGVSPTDDGICSAPPPPSTRCEIPSDNLAAFARAKDDPRHPECQGRCVKGQCLPFTPEGGPCVSSALCEPGLECVAGQCRSEPLPRVGEPCASGTTCEAGAYCDSGRCVALKSAGEPCAMPFECRALECVRLPGENAGTCGDPCGPFP